MAASETFPWDPIAEARRQWSAHGWRSSADGMAAATSIMRAQQVILARADKVLKPFGITFSRYEVLMLLYFSRAGNLPMRKIGQRLQVHPTSVTNAIDRLEKAQLVRREQHPADRRTTLIELLPAGRDLALEATAALNKDVFDDLGIRPDQLDELWDALAGLRQAAGDFKQD